MNTCSIAFADPAFDESRYAAMVAQRYGTRHFVDRVESDDFDLIDTLAGIYDEPLRRQLGDPDLSCLPARTKARHGGIVG